MGARRRQWALFAFTPGIGGTLAKVMEWSCLNVEGILLGTNSAKRLYDRRDCFEDT